MRRHSSLAAVALVLAAGSPNAFAGLDETLKAIQQSEFNFARTTSEVPFFPMGWVQDRFYPRAVFTDKLGLLAEAGVVENSFDIGLVMPVYVTKRTMLVLGGDLASDNLDVRSGPYQDQRILRLTPVFAWLKQVNPKDLVAVFAAPIFSKELRNSQPWGASGYGGVIAMHQSSSALQVIYGGVYEYSFGQNAVYPYFGVLWSLTPKVSLSLTFPWPTLSYVPRDRWLLSVGLAPGGSSWVARSNGFETTQSFGSWNLSTGVGYRLHGKFWLFGGLGVAGLRGVKIGGDEPRFESKPGAVFTLALQFRP